MSTATKQRRILKGTRIKVTDISPEMPQSLNGMYGTVIKRDTSCDWSIRLYDVKFSNRVNPVPLYETEFELVKSKKK